MEGLRICGNCNSHLGEDASSITTILSTWREQEDASTTAPQSLSISEALAVVFEIPPLTPNGRDEGGRTKQVFFERESRFKAAESGSLGGATTTMLELCWSCSETLTVLYNSWQEFTAICKLESQIGRILKDIEGGVKNPRFQQKAYKKRHDVTDQREEAVKKVNFEKRDVASREELKAIVKAEPANTSGSDNEDEFVNNGLDDFNCPSPMSADASPALPEEGLPVECSQQQKEPLVVVTDFRHFLEGSGDETFHDPDDEEEVEFKILPNAMPRMSLRPNRRVKVYREENTESDISDSEKVDPLREKVRKKRNIISSSEEETPILKNRQQRPRRHTLKRSKPASRGRKKASSNKAADAAGVELLTCLQCRKRFLHETTLLCHRRLVHREDVALVPLIVPPNPRLVKVSSAALSVGPEEKRSMCPVCRLLVRRSDVRSHLSAHTRSPKRPWLCIICGREAKSHTALFEHMKLHRRPISCKQCGKCVARLEMIKHLRICRQQQRENFRCKFCKLGFMSRSLLMEHRARVHGHVWKCQLCTIKFTERAKMVEHMMTHRTKNAYTCKICDKSFNRIGVLRLHVKRFHRSDKPRSAPKRKIKRTPVGHQPGSTNDECGLSIEPFCMGRFICKECDSQFATYALLETHLVDVHSNAEEFACSICSRKFQDLFCLKLHLKVHTETRMMTCFVCHKTYKEKSAFFYHLKDRHSVENDTIFKKYPDVFIGGKKAPTRVYPRPPRGSTRAKQAKTVEAANPVSKQMSKGEFPCETCEKVFAYRLSLENHIRVIHQGTKDYVCSFCGKAFARKQYFELHERLHTTTDCPYKCHLCGKGFRLPGNLKAHLKSSIHNKRRDYVCEICGKDFNRMDNMKLHVKAVHMKIQTRKPRSHSPKTYPDKNHRWRLELHCAEEDKNDNTQAADDEMPGTSQSFSQEGSIPSSTFAQHHRVSMPLGVLPVHDQNIPTPGFSMPSLETSGAHNHEAPHPQHGSMFHYSSHFR